MTQLIDLSQTIASNMPVYPGDEATELVQTRFLTQDLHNNHRLTINMHAGTHVDTPMHMLPGDYVSELPLEPYIGRGCLLDVRNQPCIQWQPEYEQIIKPGSIVLLYTGHDIWYGSDRYYHNHPCVAPDFCQHLVQKQIKMLGVDMPSPDAPPHPVHKQLLANGIYILENLTNLGQLLTLPQFEIIALPLKLKADSSPVRTIAREIK